MASAPRPLLISAAAPGQPFAVPPSRGGGAANPKKARQVQRLAPRFSELEQALEARRGALQGDASGAAIEQVLVFETNGPVKDLYETVARTPGLEWLADEDLRDLAPDDDFFVRGKPGKSLTAQLYLVLFNQQALEQLLALWGKWVTDARLPAEHRGWLPVFRQLRDIRRWSTRDRLEETGVLAYWRDRLAAGFETVSVEIELWFRRSEQRPAAEARLRALVTRASGQVMASCTLEEIAYHALVCKLPIRAVERMLENPEVELLQCDEVRLVRPTGQAGSPVITETPEEEVQFPTAEGKLGDPLIGLLDGLPLENHRRLASRLVVDDPDDWAETYPVASRCHGTAMASLILHGDLGANEEPARQRLYVRPILRPDSFDGRHEQAPDDSSWVDLIHRAVRRAVAGEGNLPPAAPSVRVFSLSVGDPYQPFIRSMSPLAKLLDWLAWRYQVLFVVSAGNQNGPISVTGRANDASAEAIVSAIVAEQRHRRILSPAEALNVLTVGATAEDASGPWQPRDPRDHDLGLPQGLPSPISGLGRGYRRVVKPDVLAPGGRVVFVAEDREDGQARFTLANPRPRFPPGHRVAAPGAGPGDAAGVRYVAGTSNAAALVSRDAARIADALRDLADEPNAAQLAQVPLGLWLRTLLAHGASWPGDALRFAERALGTDQNRHTFTDEVSALLTFGKVRAERVIACSEERVTVLAGGELGAGERAVHRIPLPPSLNAHTSWRRITTTLSWFSPINPSHRKYRRASLWFDPPGQRDLLVRRCGVDWQAARRGTLQHEVLEGDRRAINVQPGAVLEVPVSCLAEAGALDGRVPYAMAFTLEVAPGVNTRIYDEVRERIAQRVGVRPGA
ncbi:MAG: S8 family peptidase [Polyangiaceae bacterium]